MNAGTFVSRFERAEAVIDNGDLEAARELLSALAREFPATILVFWRLGYVSLDLGNLLEAVLAFRRALQLDAANPQAIGGIVQVYMERQEWNDAVCWFRRRLALGERGQHLVFLSYCLINLQQYAEAEEALGRASNRSRNLTCILDLFVDFSTAFWSQKRCFKRPLNLTPDYEMPWRN